MSKIKRIAENEKLAKVTGSNPVELAQLDAQIELVDKINEVVKAVRDIPQVEIPETIIPEQKDVIFPDVQRVEVINPPQEKDDKEIKKLLKDLVAEVKKKEQYAYDIKIDASLKKELRGKDGKDGRDGKDGTEIDASTIAEKLESLEKGDKLKMSAIENLEDTIATLQNRTQLLNQIATTRQSSSSTSAIILTSQDGTRWQLSIGNDGVLITTSL